MAAAARPCPTKPTRQRGGARRDWSRRTEAASLKLPAALLAEARANSRALADMSLLAVLAREVALTRGAEITLAYRSVILVSSGFKKSQYRGANRLTTEPCVVFVVRRKWTADETAVAHPQHLPRWLVAYAEYDGERKPFALATDVQQETAFFGARAHGDGGVWLKPEGLRLAVGAIACAAEVRHAAGSERCLLSAQHVFSPEPDVDALAVAGNLGVRPLDDLGKPLNAPVIALTQPWGGVLRGEEDPELPSFDVQLALLDRQEVALARGIVGAPRLSATEPFVASYKRLIQFDAAGSLQLAVPQNHLGIPARDPLKARVDCMLDQAFAILYDVRRGARRTEAWIYHAGLVKLDVEGPLVPLAGDSGSAVVIQHDDDSATLIGLYIGGKGSAAYVIPAWQLFDIRNYWSLPSGAQLRPVSL